MTRAARIFAAVSAAALAVPVFGVSRAAAQPAPAVPRAADFDNFRIEKIGGEVFVEGESRDRETTSAGNTTSQSDLFLEEGVELDAAGSVYHSNFLQWIARGEFGLRQNWSDDGNGGSDNGDGRIEGYALDAYLLRHKPLSLHGFTSYQHDFDTRDFASTVEFEDARHGFDVTHRGALTSQFLFEYGDETELSDFRDTTEQSTLYRFTTGQRLSDPQRDWELRLEHEDTDETTSFGNGAAQDLPTQRDEVALRHSLQFGNPLHPHVLTGNALYADRSGFLDSTNLRLDEQLSLGHTPSFGTFYRGHFSEQTSEEALDRFTEGEVGFIKSIYASLDLTGSAFARRREFDGGQERAVGGEADLRYRKWTRPGAFYSNLTASRAYEQEESDTGTRRVIDEPAVLTGGDFVALDQPNVAPGTIVVTDLDQTQVYVEGVQYVVRQTGNITEIARVIGATDPIPDGATVLVDYTAGVATDAEFTADRLTWSNRFTFHSVPVSLYTTVQRREETLTGGDDPGNLESFTSWLFGTEWSKDGLTLALEHEIVDTDLGIPYTADRARARYTRFVGPDLQLTVGGDAQWYRYDDADLIGDEDVLNTYTVFGQATHRLRDDLLWRNRAEYRTSEGRTDLTTAEVSSGVEWSYRQLEFLVEGRYRTFEQDDSEGDLAELRFSLRRFF